MVCGLAGVGWLATNHIVLADTWQVTPQPQRLSELYFTHHQQLPDVVAPQTPQRVVFTIHNLEHQTTVYHYTLIVLTNNSIEEQLGHGTITLTHDQSQTIEHTLVIPPLGDRVAVKVKLEYQGIIAGSKTAHWQTQSIHYWVKLVDAPANQEREP